MRPGYSQIILPNLKAGNLTEKFVIKGKSFLYIKRSLLVLFILNIINVLFLLFHSKNLVSHKRRRVSKFLISAPIKINTKYSKAQQSLTVFSPLRIDLLHKLHYIMQNHNL